jgi:hypothetical protein
MSDISLRKLGRKAVKTDSRTLQMAKYTTALPPAPPAVDWTKGITSWGMMLNDQLGDCTIAGVGHAVQVWSANTTGEITVPDSQILHYYEKWDGYKPKDPSTDQGGVELDVLNDWQKGGFDKHKLLAFADPAFSNVEEVRQAINLFGGVYIGVSLPKTANTQLTAGRVWDVVTPSSPDTAPGSWGGHCVFVPKYDANGFTCITWGQLQTMTLAFWNAYVDEAHALLSQDWLNGQGTPAGLDLAQLKADLALIQ